MNQQADNDAIGDNRNRRQNTRTNATDGMDLDHTHFKASFHDIYRTKRSDDVEFVTNSMIDIESEGNGSRSRDRRALGDRMVSSDGSYRIREREGYMPTVDLHQGDIRG